MPTTDVPYVFALYVTGRTRRSERAARNLRQLCEERLGDGNFEIEIVDVLDYPARAELERVIATPTVIRLVPVPRRRVIGDLSIAEQAANALDLPPPLRLLADGDAG